MIWKDNKKESNINNKLANDVELAEETIKENTNKNELEERIENILSNIQGVGNVKVLITYSETSQTLAMYNEDLSSTDTQEEDSGRSVPEK